VLGLEYTTIEMCRRLLDPESFEAHTDDLETPDPLGYPGYLEAVARLRSAGTDESVLAARGSINGRRVEIAAFAFAFMGGSMGEVAGERLARGLERAADQSVPFVLLTSTGGARMQEGMRALVQMPKVVAARLGLAAAHQPLVALFDDPTTGGVLASIAGLADFTAARPRATVGFAGPRIVHRVTGAPPSEQSHTSESALANGLVDAIDDDIPEQSWVRTVITALAPDQPRALPAPRLVSEPDAAVDEWAAVSTERAGDRPTANGLLVEITDSLVEMRGDRAGCDDRAVVTALVRVAGRRAIVLALDRNSAPGPAGFRKARRAVAVATRLDLPLVTLIDTPGADPAEESEAGGVAWEIAALTEALLTAPVPVLTVLTGEGGSGGGLAFAVGDVLLAYTSSIFSIIRPEAAAEILWRDPNRAPEAAELLKPSAHDLLRFGIADALVDEPLTAKTLQHVLAYHLDLLDDEAATRSERAERRRKRWRRSGT
jgi:acetyl-CoA carboxylase carboxyl transferase subunit beta